MKTAYKSAIAFCLVTLFAPLLLTSVTMAGEEPELEWKRTFHRNWDEGYCVQQTTECGYIIAGFTGLGPSDPDVYLIKTDPFGNEEWSKTFAFGGSEAGEAYSVQQTTDGGYIIAGATWYPDSYDIDVYLIKTDPFGNEEWHKTFGGSETDMAYSVRQTTDGGYIIAGRTDFTDPPYDQSVYLIKTDPFGNEEWHKAFGNDAEGYSVQQTTDGGYIITGFTGNPDPPYNTSVYLIKTDPSGNEEWHKTFDSGTYGYSVQQTTDGGYIIAGATLYPDSYDTDVCLIKTDPSGNEEWHKTFSVEVQGVRWNAEGYCVQQTTDGGYIIAGIGGLIKTDPSGNEEWRKTYYGAALSAQQTRDGGYIIAGTTRRFDTGADIDLIKLTGNEPLGSVTYVSGNVSVSSICGDVQVGDLVRDRDVLETRDNSVFSVKTFMLDKMIELGSNSKAKLSRSEQKTTCLELFKGKLRLKVRSLGEEQLEIRTPMAVMAHKGTELVVVATVDETLIMMLEGAADVSTVDGSESIILEENYGVVVTDQGLGAPFPIDPAETERWWPKQMVITVASPVDLYVTDPMGRHIGRTPAGEIVNEIPAAYYTGPDVVPEEIIIPDPVQGSYEIALLATGTGPYHLAVLADVEGASFMESFSGAVEEGQVIKYDLAVGEEAAKGDLDGNGDVDRDDLNIILSARNTPADGPDDPRDLDGDGMITALDARKLVLLCTRPRCTCE